jgi:threonine/homoserine/homoserine lactone efflux protein
MHASQILAFAGAMIFWTSLPGPGLAAVLSRTLGAGPRAGLAVTAGLALADALYLVIAVAGLVAIAKFMAPMLTIVKYAAAAYLIWQGVRLFAAGDPAARGADGRVGVRWTDVGYGSLITLANPKAILFYSAILPSFLDMTEVRAADLPILIAISAASSFTVYGVVVAGAHWLRRHLASTRAARRLRQATGSILICSGVAVAMR